MLAPGDKVAALDDELEGKVVAVQGSTVQIETSDGFVMEFDEKELVKVDSLKEVFRDSHLPLSEILKEKESQKKRRSQRVKPKERNAPPMEVDLHIHKLVDRYGGMSNYEILNLQLETAKRQLEFAINKRIQKIVFIHGVGEGILKAEIDTLFRRYENIKFYDADYRKYGLGATEVYILQNS